MYHTSWLKEIWSDGRNGLAQARYVDGCEKPEGKARGTKKQPKLIELGMM